LHVLASAAPILNGGAVVGALAIWQDISVREQMRTEAETAAEKLRVTEEELRAQEAELRQQGSELVRAVSGLDRPSRQQRVRGPGVTDTPGNAVTVSFGGRDDAGTARYRVVQRQRV
jgi:hypothetical protein